MSRSILLIERCYKCYNHWFIDRFYFNKFGNIPNRICRKPYILCTLELVGIFNNRTLLWSMTNGNWFFIDQNRDASTIQHVRHGRIEIKNHKHKPEVTTTTATEIITIMYGVFHIIYFYTVAFRIDVTQATALRRADNIKLLYVSSAPA
jgi:hypothetical protein